VEPKGSTMEAMLELPSSAIAPLLPRTEDGGVVVVAAVRVGTVVVGGVAGVGDDGQQDMASKRPRRQDRP
jgi:hypothetical protein